MVLGGDNAISEVAFAGKVNVGHVVVNVDASSHFAVESSLSTCFHLCGD